LNFSDIAHEIENLPSIMPKVEDYGITQEACDHIWKTDPKCKTFNGTTESNKVASIVGGGAYFTTFYYLVSIKNFEVAIIILFSIFGGWIPFLIVAGISSNIVKKIQRLLIPKKIFNAHLKFNKDTETNKKSYLEAYEHLGIKIESYLINPIYPNHNLLIDNWTYFFDKIFDGGTYYPANFGMISKRYYTDFLKFNLFVGLWNNDSELVKLSVTNFMHNLPYFRDNLDEVLIDPSHLHYVNTQKAKEHGVAIDMKENIKESAKTYDSLEYKKYKKVFDEVTQETYENGEFCRLIQILVEKTRASRVDIFSIGTPTQNGNKKK
jgi:hypothetical protein